eukprot:a339903_333.p1 GENE.a339903_333~~a339903_333.p1  ORF type:complete len:186 (-),score=21.76 a339903_333:31-549(-)
MAAPPPAYDAPTAVPVAAPVAAPVAPIAHPVGGAPGQWSSGTFDCFNDMNTCLCGTFCTPCQEMQTKAFLEGRPMGALDYVLGIGMGILALYYVGWICEAWCNMENRKKIKERFNIVDPTGRSGMVPMDYVCSCCCVACVSCQHARELNIRGVNPTLPKNNAAPPVAAPMKQ